MGAPFDLWDQAGGTMAWGPKAAKRGMTVSTVGKKKSSKKKAKKTKPRKGY